MARRRDPARRTGLIGWEWLTADPFGINNPDGTATGPAGAGPVAGPGRRRCRGVFPGARAVPEPDARLGTTSVDDPLAMRDGCDWGESEWPK